MKKIICVSIAIFTLLLARTRNCPTSISVYGPSDQLTAGDTLVFSVQLNGAGSVSPTYNWSISAGTIMSGQGTAMIMVNVDLGGFPRECNTSSSQQQILLRLQ